MAETYKFISDINVRQQKWTSKVIVAEKYVAKTSHNQRTRYQNMVLIDMQGNKVQCALYNYDITAFKNTLIWSNTYLISNATVKFTDPKRVAAIGPIQWTINGKTKVQAVEEDNRAFLFSTYQIVSFAVLHLHMDNYNEIDVLGVVIDVLPKKIVQTKYNNESCIQELVLVNEK
ncbi:replication protein A 70 kDa DNA-binding subunit D-like [Forsythia ovata]|uniref:Replication protein A 70 kDa DNA-binding subunit D-like n=1 Tax=Forsythia ovata TaxID=205694 RepID=A0ABD1UTM1_9LAMI